jgi:hypothetical protein
MDYSERGALTAASLGTILGMFRCAEMGRDGLQINGAPIRARAGKELRVTLGPGVSRGPDGVLTAAIGGSLVYVPGKLLDVVELHVQDGDVGPRSGNLHTGGSVKLTGSVVRDFMIEAAGNVEIGGGIDGGTVVAGANLSVKGGVLGSERGFVVAGHEASIGHCHRAEIRCTGTLTIERECSQAHIECGALQVKQRLVGGETIVETSLQVAELGSPHGAPTLVIAGEPISDPVGLARARLARSALDRRRQIRAEPRHGGSSRGATEIEDGANSAILAQRRRARELAQAAIVQVSGVLHPGTEIRIGTQHITIDRPHTCVQVKAGPETLHIEPWIR